MPSSSCSATPPENIYVCVYVCFLQLWSHKRQMHYYSKPRGLGFVVPYVLYCLTYMMRARLTQMATFVTASMFAPTNSINLRVLITPISSFRIQQSCTISPRADFARRCTSPLQGTSSSWKGKERRENRELRGKVATSGEREERQSKCHEDPEWLFSYLANLHTNSYIKFKTRCRPKG